MVQIRIAKDLDNHVRATAGAMTVDELLARFPEVPRDLQAEPVLERYVAAWARCSGSRRSRRPAWERAATWSTCCTRVS